MARLNEPPAAPGPSADTVDVVKRRYLRQNRELAKTNSQQSIRIRNLEAEGSRLLAENLSLREHVLHLQHTLETQSNRPSFDSIDAVKERLEAKLLEFGSIVAKLGDIRKVDSEPRYKTQTATRRSPDERQWRSGLGLQEVENAMLPTIVEDKYFPRRTMSADELEGILEDPDILSPDIGPPPVSRFENEEPISFDPNPPLEKDMEQAGEDAEPALSVNLETRKRRRESGPKLDGRRVSIFESPPETREERASRGVRAGAKRKFSVQQDDDKPTPQVEDFKFTHRKTPNVSEDESSSKDARPPSPERPVLRNKPVNTDPILSPKKQRSSATDKPDKKPLSSSKSTRGRLTITRTSQPELPALRMPQQIPVAEINLEALPPKTPAVEDIFSPPSTEPSTSRPEAKDTPPPGDLTSSDQTGARPSRRARPQVSYKEPSLNTKMRRPGKELVDAVQSHHNPRASVEATPGSLGQSTIKREPDDPNSAWKSFPIVPTQRGDEVGEAGSPLKEKLGRREAESVPEKPKLNSSAASEAISALISATSTSRRKAPTTLDTQTGASSEPLSKVETCTSKSDKLATIKQEEKDTLAIFDFTASSPNDSTAPRSQFDLAKSIKSSRRHSSVPASSATEERKTDPRTKTDGGLPSIHSRTGSVAGVKSSSTSNLARSTSASKALAKDKKTGALPTTGSNMDLKAAAEGTATSSLRAERAASRRKSMML